MSDSVRSVLSTIGLVALIVVASVMIVVLATAG